MNRASPATLRKCAELANEFIKIGIAFVPMPVSDDAEFHSLGQEAVSRMEEIYRITKSEEKGGAA